MKNLNLNPQFNTMKPVTACSLVKSGNHVIAESNIRAGMSPKEISAVVSDHLINVVKQQFDKTTKK